MSPKPSRSSPLPAHGTSWTACWVTPERAATPTSAEAGVDDAAHRHPLAERDRDQLGGDADGGQGEQVRRRLGEGEADPRADADVAAEQRPGVAVVDEQVDEHAEQHRQHEQQADRRRRAPTRRRTAPGACACPGARVVSTVAATETAAAARPMTSRPSAARNRSTMSASPPPGPPLLARATIDEDEAAEPGPEAGRGEAGEGQRAGADLQRHDGDGEAEQERDQHAEDEADAERRRTAAAGRRRRAACRRRRCARRRAARRARRRPSRASSDAPMNSRPMTLESLDVSHAASDETHAVAGRRTAARPRRRRRRSVSGAMSVVLIGGAHAATARATAFGRAPGHYRSAVAAGRNRSPPRSRLTAAHEDVEREGGEQHRDVGDAVREHPHARRRRRVAGRGRRWRRGSRRRARRRRRRRSSRGRRPGRARASTTTRATV